MTAGHRGDPAVRLWDASKGDLIAKLEGQKENIWCAKFFQAGNRIVTTTDESTFVWNAITGQLLAKAAGHMQVGVCAAFSLDGTQLATGSRDCARL